MSGYETDGIYIGDADRDEATQLLGEHYRYGRLDADEYGHRIQQVTSARTQGQLRATFAPLPHPWPSCLRPAAATPPPMPMQQQPMQQPIATTNVYVGGYQPAGPVGPSNKSRVVAGLLQIFLPFGVGRFYTGHSGLGVAQFLVSLFTFGFGALWSIIDGIVLLVGGGTDIYGRPLQ